MLGDFIKNFREAVRDLNDKTAAKEKELRNAVDERAKNVTPESVMYEVSTTPFQKNVDRAYNGTLFDTTSDADTAMMYANPYPITAENAAQIEPYRQQFYQFFNEYTAEEDPVNRMIIIDKYGMGPLGQLPLTGEILQNMGIADKFFADEKKRNPYYKQNANSYLQMFEGELDRFRPKRA